MRRDRGCQMGNQNQYIEEGQTTQLPNETGKTIIYKILLRNLKKDRTTRTTLKTRGELR